MFVNIGKKNISAGIALMLCMACGTSQKGGKAPARAPGVWQAQPIKIDGDCTDWPSPYPNYDAKAMVAYATANDAENLYVTIQTGDPLTQIKILKQGLSVMIDTSGRRETSFTINYPLQDVDDLTELFSQEGGQQKGGPSHLSRQFDQRLKKSLDGSNQYSLEGFGSCSGGYMISQAAPCGIRVKAGIDEYKQLVWEAVIPFKAILGKDRISEADAGKAISVCYAVKAFKNPSAKGNTDAVSPMGNGMGGGGMGQGTMGQGRMNSMPMGGGGAGAKQQSHMQHLYESTKTWKYFGLAWGK